MNFTQEKVNPELLTTEVENKFIKEYMAMASGNCVKVYFYCLFLAQSGLNLTLGEVAEALSLTLEEVEEALLYWEDRKLLNRGPGGAEFASLRKGVREEEKNSHLLEEDNFQGDRDLKELFSKLENLLGRLLSVKELQEINEWVSDLRIKPELIEACYGYCYDMCKTNVAYIKKVLFQWHKDGIETGEQLKQYLQDKEDRQGLYKEILRALGMNRGATQVEKDMIEGWLEVGFSRERILEACGKAGFNTAPNLRYVNKVLENWREEAKTQGRDINQRVTVTQAILNRYYEHLEKEAISQAEERRKQVYGLIPGIKKIDEDLKTLGSKISRGIIGGMSREELEKAKRTVLELESERALLLTDHDFSMDYTDIVYRCQKCRDTGVDEDGQRCSCAAERIGEAEIWQRTT